MQHFGYTPVKSRTLHVRITGTKKLPAIRALSHLFDMGLREAKEFVMSSDGFLITLHDIGRINEYIEEQRFEDVPWEIVKGPIGRLGDAKERKV